MNEQNPDDIKVWVADRNSAIAAELEKDSVQQTGSTLEQCKQNLFSDQIELIHKGIISLSYLLQNEGLVADALSPQVYLRLTELVQNLTDPIILFHIYSLISDMSEKNKVFTHKFYKCSLFAAIIENLINFPFRVPIKLSLSILNATYTWIHNAAKNLADNWHYFDLLIGLAKLENISQEDVEIVLKYIFIATTRYIKEDNGNMEKYLPIYNELVSIDRISTLANIYALDAYAKFNYPAEIDIFPYFDPLIPIISQLYPEHLDIVARTLEQISSISEEQCTHIMETDFFTHVVSVLVPEVPDQILTRLIICLSNISIIKQFAIQLVESPIAQATINLLENSGAEVKTEIIILYANLCHLHQLNSFVNQVPNILTYSFDQLETGKYINYALVVIQSIIKYKVTNNDNDFEDVNLSVLDEYANSQDEQISAFACAIIALLPK